MAVSPIFNLIVSPPGVDDNGVDDEDDAAIEMKTVIQSVTKISVACDPASSYNTKCKETTSNLVHTIKC